MLVWCDVDGFLGLLEALLRLLDTCTQLGFVTSTPQVLSSSLCVLGTASAASNRLVACRWPEWHFAGAVQPGRHGPWPSRGVVSTMYTLALLVGSFVLWIASEKTLLHFR